MNTVPSANPLVSVRMITYNHERYIGKAIESAVAQQTNFPFEILIVDDCSADRTVEICREYQKRYSHLIRLEVNPKNLGMTANSFKAT